MLNKIDFTQVFWRNKKALIDSRQINQAKQSIFFAFKGKQQDGHQYIPDLYRKGVRNFVLSSSGFHAMMYPGARFIQAESVLDVLQAWAKWHRSQYAQLPSIAITGSNGKTIVKEWLSVLLMDRFQVVKSPKSYNSQIGVPLSILGIEPKHTLGIFEAGISQKGEMQALQNIIQPQIGIFTNIGQAHAEGFENQEEKIREKLLLFKECDILIYTTDEAEIHEQVQQNPIFQSKTIYAWGQTEAANIPIQILEKTSQQAQIQLEWKGKSVQIELPFTAKAPVENSIHCIILLLHLGYKQRAIQEKILELREVKMRLELKEAVNESLLIDDSYNNDLAGLEIALDFMRRQHIAREKSPKTVILSDILQMDASAEVLCHKIVDLLAQHQIQKFIGIGESLHQYQSIFDWEQLQNIQFFKDTASFLAYFSPYDYLQADTLLIKGARAFQFEKIAQVLKKKLHSTVLEINMSALAHNFKYYRQQIEPTTKMMAMVKAFAYGSSNYEVANFLEYLGTDYLGVAYVDEGIALRQKGITVPIMVMNSRATDFNLLLRYRLEPVIYSFELLERLQKFVQHAALKFPFPIHIELDTGMHRLGFDRKDEDALLSILKEHQSQIRVVGIFSHLVASEDEEHLIYSLKQIQDFEQFTESLEEYLSIRPIRHILNTGGIARFGKCQFDMVRLGIGLHGIDPSGKFQSDLEAVATLKTVISQIHTLEADETVGYGRMGKVEKATKIVVLALGYADGFPRAFGNGVGKVYIKGKLCPIVGNICMDMCFADIGDLEVNVGDEAILFGEELSIQEQSEAIGTIPYEMLTNISMRVPRVFYEE
ncbi:MAG: bifunctional UDP-N-acetylmuramoyl-tripeptide:D-alanyl-D-alanine ligase/alanine racemase [Saprospiraceae bacterium]|nr:bifunctional UDP-N-acetylmuramoyl-tripeptide:D-alanyl-D-alanine ligase/alanine racemase [Saprospiraceae bacterium]